MTSSSLKLLAGDLASTENGPLVRCSKSCLRPQTYWLLLAISQDQPKNKYVSDLRDRCERAALEGSWVSAWMLQLAPCLWKSTVKTLHFVYLWANFSSIS